MASSATGSLSTLCRRLDAMGRWSGVTFICCLSVAIFIIAVSDTIPAVHPETGWPLTLLIHSHVFAYPLAVLLLSLTLGSLYFFHKEERKNRVAYWRNHPLVCEAIENNRLVNLPNYLPQMTPDQMANTDVTLQCPICVLETTSRAHHCPICNHCVLRRDHHCFVASGCVGLGNQRYFVNFMFWAVVSMCLFIGFEGNHSYGRCLETMAAFNNSMSSIIPLKDKVLNFLDEEVPMITYMYAVSQYTNRMNPFYYLVNCAYLDESLYFSFKIAVVGIALGMAMLALVFFVQMTGLTWMGITNYERSHPDVQKRTHPDGATISERFELIHGRWWAFNTFFPNVWQENVLTPETAVNLFRPKYKDD